MATQLQQVLTFTAVAAGGQQTVAHNMNWDGRAVIPDLLLPLATNGPFTVVSCTNAALTIQNDGGVAADFQFWLMSLHAITRAFGRQPGSVGDEFLSPLPFLVGGGSAASGGSNIQAFRYTVTGAEPDRTDFFVPLPAARASDTYRIVGTMAGATAIIPFDCPDLVASDRTTLQFRIQGASEFQVGDQIDFIVSDVVS